MPIYTVTKSDASKGGKPRVYFDNKHGWQDAYYVSPKTVAPKVGMVIDANTSSKRFDGAKSDTWFLNDWKLTAIEAGTAAIEAAQTYKANAKGWNIDAGDLSRLASNLMASAIAAGLVKEPHQLMVWAAGAYRAAESLRSGKVEDFNDEITITGPDPAERHDFDEDPGPTDGDIPF